MNQKDERKDPAPTGAPAPRRRFRLQRLEDRIAPRKGGNGTKKCVTGLCDGESTGTSGY